jgi:hypothetical protein
LACRAGDGRQITAKRSLFRRFDRIEQKKSAKFRNFPSRKGPIRSLYDENGRHKRASGLCERQTPKGSTSEEGEIKARSGGCVLEFRPLSDYNGQKAAGGIIN